ncbi:MAG TPA: hypothetical protein VLM17_01545 [Xanthomonadaceae bacterium]|nr:hypothetical protein [Xanthomonadaceae bacterium]
MTRIHLVTASVLLACAASAGAQNSTAKKLYCWTENGRKVCGDALPASAAGNARVEFSARSGRQTGEVGRALTPEEQAAAATAAEQAQAAADAEAARQRRDLAMVESYASEADLRRAYGERIALLDDSLKASRLGEANLRRSLSSLLQEAGDLELSSKPVPPALLANIRTQHVELQKQLRILGQQRLDRAGLDDDLKEAVVRYRALRQPGGAVAPATTATSAPGG